MPVREEEKYCFYRPHPTTVQTSTLLNGPFLGCIWSLRTFEAILHINIDGAKKKKRIGTLLDSSGGYSGGAEVSKEERKLIAHRG